MIIWLTSRTQGNGRQGGRELSLPGLQDAGPHHIALVCHAEPMQLGLDSVTAIGMVVAELVTNSFGHAFPGGGGAITVTLGRIAGGRQAMLTIRDDGVGFVPQAESSRRGLGLVRRLAEQVGGALDMASGDGTLWTVTFPVPAEVIKEAA